MKMPNFFIIGAPRCATTTLYEELGQHPGVFMSRVKEPLFFAVEGRHEPFHGIGDNQGIRNLSAYCALFSEARDERVIGEASPMYLSSEQAPARIKHYAPQAKLVAILRNPVDRAYSHFLFHRGLKTETITDFRAAIAAEEQRERCGWSPYWCYRKMGMYSESLARYRALFQPEQLRIFLFEDVQNDPRRVLRSIAQFLGLSDTPFSTVAARNHAVIPRNAKSEALIAKIGALPSESAILLKIQETFFSQATRLKLRRRLLDPLLLWLVRLNSRRPAVEPENRQWLIDRYYREDILRTQELLQRDLSHWLIV